MIALSDDRTLSSNRNKSKMRRPPLFLQRLCTGRRKWPISHRKNSVNSDGFIRINAVFSFSVFIRLGGPFGMAGHSVRAAKSTL
jgi:hypothetical protein